MGGENQELGGKKLSIDERLRGFGRAFKEVFFPTNPENDRKKEIWSMCRELGRRLALCPTLESARVLLEEVEKKNKAGGFTLKDQSTVTVDNFVFPRIKDRTYSIFETLNQITDLMDQNISVPLDTVHRPIQPLVRGYYERLEMISQLKQDLPQNQTFDQSTLIDDWISANKRINTMASGEYQRVFGCVLSVRRRPNELIDVEQLPSDWFFLYNDWQRLARSISISKDNVAFAFVFEGKTKLYTLSQLDIAFGQADIVLSSGGADQFVSNAIYPGFIRLIVKHFATKKL